MKVVSICLSDLPKDKITVGKNGKKYIGLVVDDKKQADQFGNDVTVYINQTKEERAAKDARVFVGQGKNFDFQNKAVAVQTINIDGDDDLPF